MLHVHIVIFSFFFFIVLHIHHLIPESCVRASLKYNAGCNGNVSVCRFQFLMDLWFLFGFQERTNIASYKLLQKTEIHEFNNG